MELNLAPLRHASLELLSPYDTQLLIAQARALRVLIDAGRGRLLLCGKNFGLLCETDAHEDAARFRRAASDLGARVSGIRPELSPASPDSEVAETGRMLGRLYDGIECVGLDAAVVERLRVAAAVPVYDCISCASHPTAKLAEQIGAGRYADESHRLIVQAILLSTTN